MSQAIVSDAQILADLKNQVAAGHIHRANLDGFEGLGSRRDRLANRAYLGLSFLARTLPPSGGSALFSWGFSNFGDLIPPVRKRIKAHLNLAFPDMDARARLKLRKQFLRRFGQTVFESLAYERFAENLLEQVNLEGVEHIHAARAAKKPLILVHAHQANWEIIFPVAKSLIDQELCGLYAALSVPQLHRRTLHRRLEGGGRPYPRHFKGALGYIMRDLRAGHPLIVALDQRAPGETYPFLGHGAQTTLVPIRLALRTGAHLIPVDIERLERIPTALGQGAQATSARDKKQVSHKFRLTFHPNLIPEGKEKTADPAHILARYNELLEGWIRARPADWFWLHERWAK